MHSEDIGVDTCKIFYNDLIEPPLVVRIKNDLWAFLLYNEAVLSVLARFRSY